MPCRRCRSRGEECVYEDKKWRTKDHLRSEIERLRAEQRQGHALIQALTDNSPKQWEAVLDRLRNDEPPDAIAEWIHSTRCVRGPSQPPRAVADGTLFSDDSNSPPSAPKSRLPSSLAPDLTKRLRTASLSSPRSRGLGQSGSSPESASRASFSAGFSAGPSPTSHFSFQNYANPAFPPPGVEPSISALGILPPGARVPVETTLSKIPEEPILCTWTSVTSDTRLVQRLLASFFSCSFPSLSLVSQSQFMDDFRHGNPRYCSEALVNAMLGRACKFFDSASQLISRVSFGDAFLGEAKRLLASEHTHVNLPSIQALGVLALTEMSHGNDNEACDLAEESVRASIHLSLQTQQQYNQLDDDFKAVRALAYCGGFSLIRILRLLAGDLEPKAGPLFMRLQPNSHDLGEDDAPQARVERGISLQMHFFAELQHCPPLARFVFEITEAVHTFSSYNFSQAMTADDLEAAYEKCIGCYKQFAEDSTRIPDGGPDLLFAHIWYHYCLFRLLQPFVANTASLEDDAVPRLRNDVTPQFVCRQSSEAIIFLTSTYQTRHSLAYLPPLLPHMVLAAVLYQLTLVVDPHHSTQQQQHQQHQQQPQQQRVFPGSPVPVSPQTAHGSQHYLKPVSLGPMPPSQDTLSSQTPDFWMVPPASPIVLMQARRATRRNTSDMSSASTCYSAGFFSGASDKDDVSTSEAGLDMLPIFTANPIDLVTIGSLQLGSMGSQNPSAAEAGRMLRDLGPVKNLVGSGLNLTLLTEALSFPMNAFPLASHLPVAASLVFQQKKTPTPDQAVTNRPLDSAEAAASYQRLDCVEKTGATISSRAMPKSNPPASTPFAV
ncbi:hypothetical protein B0T26DRAFT_257660 [Lasiosphaeria miniovina]|uniref:Xylanolytic transcriptional activator regulatory domain-containing protein n=1 Tax=Lasiosphaeria miniovina TaxID=1954250 RepID=A0AA40AWH3_9PEZI|nr:uncharacterized protein B0T26DRAFT_257660 [Lasiosphaeria miniovina]KAK0723296.1 hypothetical protein B0T26DRAFT_257660 [Lasiosphaeria miniovina]